MQLQQNIPLAPFTTLRIGGPARWFATITSEDDLLEAVRFARTHALPLFVLGGGSNLLIADSGFPGLVLHIALPPDIAWTADRTYMEVSAGHDWDAFVRIACEENLCGIECLAGIPGLVGASPVQNIGAYSQEVASTITSLRALDLEAPKLNDFAFVELPAAACRFAYRSSIFNTTHRNRYIVTRVDFQFDPAATPNLSYADLGRHFAGYPPPNPLDVYHAVRTIRDRKGMLLDPASPHADSHSAGSFFKNPVVPAATLSHIAQTLTLDPASIPHWPAAPGTLKLSAAWLIERAGFPRGYTPAPDSPVGVSTRHTLALVNRTGNATCAQLIALRDDIAAAVLARFHVPLEQEPILLG